MPETERPRFKPGPQSEKPKVQAKAKIPFAKSYKIHFEIDVKKLLKGKGEWTTKYAKISGKIVGELTASPAGEETARISTEKETSNEAVERSLKANWKWEEDELDTPLFKAIAPIDVDLKIITLEGPKLKLGQSASRFDIVKFGLSSEVEVKFADLGIVGLKLDWIDLEYEKDEYEAKLINVEIKGGVHHEFKDVDLGKLGKWDVDAVFTPTLEVEPNWKGVLA